MADDLTSEQRDAEAAPVESQGDALSGKAEDAVGEPVEAEAGGGEVEVVDKPAEALEESTGGEAPQGLVSGDSSETSEVPESDEAATPAAVVDDHGLGDFYAPGDVADMGDAVSDATSDEPVAVEPVVSTSKPAGGEAGSSDEELEMEWYVLKVQVNREDSIAASLERRVAMHGLEKHVGKVLVPSEKVTEVRGGKKRTVRRKLLPGYIVVQMAINDDTWFLVRETSGIGDFTGSGGKPTPMEPHEVQRLLATEEGEQQEAKIKIGFQVGDHVKINEGPFENFEGDVHAIDDTNGIVWVMINIFGRNTPVRFEYWQIEAAE